MNPPGHGKRNSNSTRRRLQAAPRRRGRHKLGGSLPARTRDVEETNILCCSVQLLGDLLFAVLEVCERDGDNLTRHGDCCVSVR